MTTDKLINFSWFDNGCISGLNDAEIDRIAGMGEFSRKDTLNLVLLNCLPDENKSMNIQSNTSTAPTYSKNILGSSNNDEINENPRFKRKLSHSELNELNKSRYA